MKQSDFEKSHEATWHVFERILEESTSARSFFKRIEEYDELNDFPEQYNRVSHHLAIAKQRRYSASLIARLNHIVTQAHNYYYGDLIRLKSSFLHHLFAGFPIALRKNARFFWVAAGLFFLPGFLFTALCFYSDELIYSLMSFEQVSEFESMYESSNKEFGRERGSDTDIVMFCFYIMNNIGISFQTFAGGILFGLGSIFFLCYNGIYIGAAAGHMAKVGYTDTFFPFVIGHGAFELTAIAIAGAAGLKLGWSLISPGNYSRMTSLKHAASEAIVIVYGSTVMLLVAAFVEAFWSSSSTLTNEIKYGVGTFFWLLVVYYLVRAGRHYAP